MHTFPRDQHQDRRCPICHDRVERALYAGPDGAVYCSEWCYRTRTPDDGAGLTAMEIMPLWRDMMQRGCPNCPREQKHICFAKERHFQYIGLGLLRDWQTMEWEAKAEEVFGGALGDGSVPHEQARRVAAAVEDTARHNAHPLVMIRDLVETLVALAQDMGYQPPADTDPAFLAAVATAPPPHRVVALGRKEEHEKMARQRADRAKAMLQVQGIIESIPGIHQAHQYTGMRDLHWCSHLPFLLGRFFTLDGFTAQRAGDLIAAAEAVARERQHPGVLPRDFEAAVLRAAAAQAERRAG